MVRSRFGSRMIAQSSPTAAPRKRLPISRAQIGGLLCLHLALVLALAFACAPRGPAWEAALALTPAPAAPPWSTPHHELSGTVAASRPSLAPPPAAPPAPPPAAPFPPAAPAAERACCVGGRPTRDELATNPPGVTILVQVGNPRIWWSNVSSDLKARMVNVKSAMKAERHGLQVFLAFQNDTPRGEIDDVEKDARSTFGSAVVRSITVENRGADIGLYLRQLQVLGREPLGAHHDVFLKLHTKSDPDKRLRWLRYLCGSVKVIRQIYTRLRQSKSIGMVGPTRAVYLAPWVPIPNGTTGHPGTLLPWTGRMVDVMNRTWEIMHPPMSFYEGAYKMARIIVGSFYWARQGAVLYDVILHSVDRLVESMPHGYKTGASGQTSHALERLMPTMGVTIRGFDVISVEDVCC